MAHATVQPDVRKALIPALTEIRSREVVAHLVSRNYGIVSKAFPRLQPFGMELYDAVKNTLYLYSRVLRDATDIDHLMRELQNAGTERYLEGAKALTVILQDIEVYLERMLRQLDDYVWQRNYRTFSDFLGLTNETRMARFRSELAEFLKRLYPYLDSMTPETSLTLNKWLSEHQDSKPLS